MGYSDFQAGIVLRLAAMMASLAALAWIMFHTSWYVTAALFIALVGAQVIGMVRFASRPAD